MFVPSTDISIDVWPHVTLSYETLCSPNCRVADVVKEVKDRTAEGSMEKWPKRLSRRVADKSPGEKRIHNHVPAQWVALASVMLQLGVGPLTFIEICEVKALHR